MESVNLPDSITAIDPGAFYDCAFLKTQALPANITEIGHEAFFTCASLESLTIPASCASIGDYAFALCGNLTSITVDAGNPVYDSRGGCNALIEARSNTLLQGCVNTVIPDTVTKIGYDAFAEPADAAEYLEGQGHPIAYPKLQSISLPASVKTIDGDAFWACTELKDVALPEGLETIGENAFDCCLALKELDIPATVTSIGPYAFRMCTSLAALQLPEGVESVEDGLFYGCAALESVNIPSGVTSIGSYAFQDCTSLTSIMLPSTLTSIGYNAFSGVTATIDFAGSHSQWAAISDSGKPAEPASYGMLDVIFNVNGGSEVATQYLKAGEKATKPADPTKEYATFVGWYADEACEIAFDFDAAIAENTTVYAKRDEMLVVTFNSCGGSAVETQHVWAGEKATQPTDPAKDGREFVGWYTDQGYGTAFDFDTAIAQSTTLYAKWRIAGSGEDDPDGGAAYAKFDSGTGTLTFQNCSSLQTLDMSGFDTSGVENQSLMFKGCTSLEQLKLGEKTTFTSNTELPLTEWQFADLGDTSCASMRSPTTTGRIRAGTCRATATWRLPAWRARCTRARPLRRSRRSPWAGGNSSRARISRCRMPTTRRWARRR